MKNQEITIKIRHDESDRQGCVHHTCFPIYMEEGRFELMKKLRFDSRKFEDSGGAILVTELKISFYFPVNYGDELNIKTTLYDIQESTMRFVYIMYNQIGNLVAKANTTFLCTSIKSGKNTSNLKDYFGSLENKVKEHVQEKYEFKGI